MVAAPADVEGEIMGVEESGSRLAVGGASARGVPASTASGHRRLMIIVYHAVFFDLVRDAGGTLLWNLNAGVWIFFVVSGFLLYRPFAAAHLARGSGVELPGYALRRVARIYPAYWAVLAFFTFVVPRAVIHGTDGFLLHVTLTQTYVHTPNPFLVGLPPAWSLVVELSFYVFLPVCAVIGACARRAARSRSSWSGSRCWSPSGWPRSSPSPKASARPGSPCSHSTLRRSRSDAARGAHREPVPVVDGGPASRLVARRGLADARPRRVRRHPLVLRIRPFADECARRPSGSTCSRHSSVCSS
jgi:hypothetical protein